MRVSLIAALCVGLLAQLAGTAAAKRPQPPAGPQPLALGASWSDYGNGFAGARVHKDAFGRVHLSGVVRSADWSELMAILPAGMRPAERVIAQGNVHASSARVDVLRNGEVRYVAGQAQWPWVSLSGISFHAAPAKGRKGTSALSPISLASGWSDFGSGYETAATYAAGGKVSAQGVLRAGESLQVGTLAQPHPSGRLVFSALTAAGPSRVDVLGDGRVVQVVGGAGWLTLSAIAFATPSAGIETPQPLPLLDGWVDYGEPYAGATVFKDSSGRVHVQGTIRDGTWGLFARLPEGYRPTARLIFSADNNGAVTRVDVTPEGHLLYAGGSTVNGWISLSGISFDTG